MHAAALSALDQGQDQDQTELRALLANLAQESGELADTADGLQVLFGRLMADPPNRPDDALEQAQALDGLVQRLQGLQSFLHGLSEAPLPDLAGHAAQVAATLRLTSQARRFSPAGAEACADVLAGDCDLF